MQQLNQVLKQRQQFYRRSSTESSVPSIELPDEISQLITGSDYWKLAKSNRYRMLIREGHLRDLLELVELAQAKDKPSHWFATAASKKQWERTLDFLAKARAVAQTVAEVVKRISVPASHMKVVFKAAWRKGQGVVRHAVTAAETGRDPFKYFCWLVWKGDACKASC